MHQITRNNNNLFIIGSLLSWFLKFLYNFQINFFIIIVNFFFKKNYNNLYVSENSKFLYFFFFFVNYQSFFIYGPQTLLLIVFYCLKRISLKLFKSVNPKSMLAKSIQTCLLYIPTVLATPNTPVAVLTQLQSKLFYLLFFFFVLSVFC